MRKARRESKTPDEQTNAWYELTDEEIEMAAGGISASGPINPILAGLQDIGLGLKDIFTGDVTEGRELILWGAELIGAGLSIIRHRP